MSLFSDLIQPERSEGVSKDGQTHGPSTWPSFETPGPCGTRLLRTRAAKGLLPLSRDSVPVVIVGPTVAGEPALELGVAILEAHGVDLFDVGRVDGELDLQPVRARRVDRLAVAVVGRAERQASGFHTLGDLAVGF